MDRPIEAPPLRWFFQAAERRRIAWQYWVRDTVFGVFYTLAYYAMRATSVDTCSWIGDKSGQFARRHIAFALGDPRRHRGHEALARKNWLRLRPQDNAPKVVEAAMDAAFRNVWRTVSEMAVLDRLWPEGRVAVEGLEHLVAARATGRPTIVAGVHLGNWEIFGPMLGALGYPTIGIYQEPPNRFDHRLCCLARERCGFKLAPLGRAGALAVSRALKERREILLVFIDEAVEGRVSAPFFGRPAKAAGNIAYVIRWAAMTDAIVIPAYCLRLGGAKFRMTFLPPFELVRAADGEADVLESVRRLNAVFEPIVLAHLSQWLWLFDYRPER